MRFTGIFSIYARLAIAVSFLSAVADRLGWWGAPGSKNAAWGNWENFLQYSGKLTGIISTGPGFTNAMAVTATVLETLFSLLLLIGWKTRVTALCSGLLLLAFALSMTFSLGVKAPLNFSVFTAAAAAFLLAVVPAYPFSVDNLRQPAHTPA